MRTSEFHLLPRVTATASPSLSLVPGVILLPCQITLIIDSMMVMMTMVMLRMMRMMRMTRMMRMMMMAMGEIMISVVTNKMVTIFGSRTGPKVRYQCVYLSAWSHFLQLSGG